MDGQQRYSKRKRCYLNMLNRFPHRTFYVTFHIAHCHAKKGHNCSGCVSRARSTETQNRGREMEKVSHRSRLSHPSWTRALRFTLIKCRVDRVGWVGVGVGWSIFDVQSTNRHNTSVMMALCVLSCQVPREISAANEVLKCIKTL